MEDRPDYIDIQAVMSEMRQVQQKSRSFVELLTRNDVLSQNHITLLMDLKLTGSMRITDISERFFITAGAATSMCDKLEDQGLVCRTRTKEDRRVVMVALTEAGEEKVSEIFKRIPPQKLRTIADVFKQVNELMDRIVE
ncbi:MarR family winged helix-turn-helix transcriptional regulator [Paenibacillus sp. GCM10012303]|uniref:MarR family winged helix-turn-helix transcriptional regulator n=1 Tax=Paenibacillus sp. GCM10012303 TaxID=3317340 RepID=UPI00360EEB3F